MKYICSILKMMFLAPSTLYTIRFCMAMYDENVWCVTCNVTYIERGKDIILHNVGPFTLYICIFK